MAQNGTTPSVGAVQTTLTIIDALRELDGAGVTELADHIDAPKSTVHNHLTTLERNEYVVREEETYRTSLRFLEHGGNTRNQRVVYDVAKPKIEELAERTGEIANLAVEERGQGVYLMRERGEQAVHLDTYAGKHIHLHSTALGKAILAFMPADQVEAIIDSRGLPPSTPDTVTYRDELEDQLEEIREQGVAFDDEERLDGLRCVAAPVETSEGVTGAVSVSGPTSRIQGELFRKELPEIVSEVADVIAINLKYQ